MGGERRGQGATFIVELPITDAPAPSTDTKHTSFNKTAEQTLSVKIMVIETSIDQRLSEDSPDHRRVHC
jgi:hypothetical protein